MKAFQFFLRLYRSSISEIYQKLAMFPAIWNGSCRTRRCTAEVWPETAPRSPLRLGGSARQNAERNLRTPDQAARIRLEPDQSPVRGYCGSPLGWPRSSVP